MSAAGECAKCGATFPSAIACPLCESPTNDADSRQQAIEDALRIWRAGSQGPGAFINASEEEAFRAGYRAALADPSHPRNRRLRKVLEQIADPEKWSGNDCDSRFYGHLTPKEIATNALEGSDAA